MNNTENTEARYAYSFPISVKGIIFQANKVVLLKNERNEWELPGGKLELGESPEQCVAREIEEELSLKVDVGSIVDTWVYTIREGVIVFIVTYGCFAPPFAEITHSSEHKAVGMFDEEDIKNLNMPQGYKNSITKWSRTINGSNSKQISS